MGESYNEHVKEFWEKQTTLDRIDNNLWYNKSNCKWSTFAEQSRNKRNSRKIRFEWKLKNIKDWSTEKWLNDFCVIRRLERWWSIEDALNKPSMRW